MKLRAFGFLFLGWFATELNVRAGLRLVCDLKGDSVSITRISINRLIGRSGTKMVDVPFDASFRVEGDLAREARMLYWPSACFLTNPLGRDRLSAAKRPWFAQVDLRRGPTFDSIWPTNRFQPALVVFAWVLNGTIIRTKVRLWALDKGSLQPPFDELFSLSELEAKGQLMLLAWSDGHFIEPRPWFKTEMAQAALSNLLLGNTTALTAALEHGLDACATGRDGCTLLHFAAAAGMVEAVDLLLKRGAKIETSEFDTPLQRAAANGRLSTVERLLSAEADPNRGDALSLALRFNHDRVALALLARGARGYEAHLEAAMHAGFVDVARKCHPYWLDQKLSAERQTALLMEQTERGHTEMVKFLLEQRWDPNVQIGGRTPLLVAAASHDSELMKALLQGGAKAGFADANGTTALLVACTNLDLPCARALVDAGADVNATRKDGNTSLHFAAIGDSVLLVDLLLNHGAQLSPLGAGRLRPIEVALLAGASSTARLLSAKGAHCDFRPEVKDELIQAALKLDVVAVVRDALAQGWDPRTLFDGRWSPFWIAENSGARNVLEVLAEMGVKAANVLPMSLIPLSQLDAVPALISADPPRDVRDLNDRGVQQSVEIKMVVDETGHVLFPRIQVSSDGRLNLMALQAVQNWRFAIPTRGSSAVCTEVIARVVFKAVPKNVVDDSAMDVAPVKIAWSTAPLSRMRETETGSLVRDDVRGNIRLQLLVNVDGNAEEMKVLSAPDSESADAVISAASWWLFTPGIRDGTLVPTRMELSVFGK